MTTSKDRTLKISPICRKNVEKQIVYGVVYAPGEIDAHGETMFAKDIEKMAHVFMRLMSDRKGAVIDQQHDNIPLTAYPVESYIETDDNQRWPVGSWVMGGKIEDATVWDKVKKGELNGFSFEAMVRKIPMVVDVEYETDTLGVTSGNEGHNHVFFAEFNEEGNVVGGVTSFDSGHRHEITIGTATDFATAPGLSLHSHRINV